MKRLIVVVVVSLILVSSVLGAKHKNNISLWKRIKLIKAKLAKSNTKHRGQIAVAGVRGSDVSSVSGSGINPSDLIWLE